MQLYHGYLQLLLTSLATYYLAKFRIGGRRMPWIVFVFQMGHLTANHLVRHYGGIPLTTIEITAAQMVLVMNLTTFAWDVYDGQIRSYEQCDDAQKKTRISKMPSLLEFLGYAFYFPGVMIGPSTRFSDYARWADNSIYPPTKGASAEVKEAEKQNSNSGRVDLQTHNTLTTRQAPEGRVVASLTSLAVGIFFTAIFSLYGAAWDYHRLLAPVAEGGVRDWPIWKRIVFANVAGFVARTKYYGVWSLTNVS